MSASNDQPARPLSVVDLPADPPRHDGVTVRWQEPRPTPGFICFACRRPIDPNTETWVGPRPYHTACASPDRKPDLLRYRGPSWYDGAHGKRRTNQQEGSTMSFTPVVAELPARSNALELLVPDLDAIVAAMDSAKAGQAVIISEPFDKESRARNLGRLTVEKLGERTPPIVARAHVVPIGEGEAKKHAAAVSYKPPEKEKATGTVADKPAK